MNIEFHTYINKHNNLDPHISILKGRFRVLEKKKAPKPHSHEQQRPCVSVRISKQNKDTGVATPPQKTPPCCKRGARKRPTG
jgi:hypothetical protein